MEEGFVYSVELEDKVSGPAHAEIRALRELAEQTLVTEKAMLALIGAEKKASAPHARTEGEGFFSKVAKDATKGLAAATIAIRAIDALKEGIVEGTTFALEAAEFKENTIQAYAAVQGTAEEGERTFEAIDKMARVVHMPAEKAHGLAQELMQQGLEDTALITATIGATSALIREGQTKGAEKLRGIIEKSTASGHFELKIGGGKGKAESGKALAGLGVSLPNLLEELSHRLGKSREQVKAELKAGKIDTETGIAAIVDTIQNGPIGRAAKNKFGLEDFRTDIANTFREAAQDTNLEAFNQALVDAETALGGMAEKGGPLRSIFQTIVDGTSSAIESVVLLGMDLEIFGLQVELAVGPIDKDMIGAIEDLGGAVLGTAGALVDFGKILVLGVVEAARLAVNAVEEVGMAVGFLFDTLAHPTKIGANFEALSRAASKTNEEAARSFVSTGENIGKIFLGKDLGQGIATGIEGASPGVEGAMSGTVDRGIAAGRRAADAHSPSEETKALGRDMSDGLAIGLDSDALAQSIHGGITGGIGAVGASGGGGGSSDSQSYEFNFNGNLYVGGELSDDDGLKQVVASAMSDMFERFALELGEQS